MRRLASRYMTRFQCTGTSCEDTCCSGSNWLVPLSESDYQRVEAALAGDPAGERFRQAFRVAPGAGSVFAIINPKPDGTCHLLEDDRLCNLHRRFGEAVLPDVCATYPRSVGRIGDRIELSGLVSCPEVARLLLLAADATDPVKAEPPAFGRGSLDREIDPGADDAYLNGFLRVRAALLTLMARRDYPVASRLFFCAFLAEQLAPIHHRGAPAGPLDELIARVLSDAVLAQLHQQFLAASLPGSIAPAIIIAVLEARLRKPCSPVFERLVAAVAADYLGEAGLSAADGLRALGPERLWKGHLRRRQVSDEQAARVDQYFTNYCANALTHDWFVQRDTLQHHLQTLLARVALLRFLLFARPISDAAAVEVFYSTARALEHNLEQRDSLADALRDNRFVTLPHAVSLLKF
jgi:lysine-N-methylase